MRTRPWASRRHASPHHHRTRGPRKTRRVANDKTCGFSFVFFGTGDLAPRGAIFLSLQRSGLASLAFWLFSMCNAEGAGKVAHQGDHATTRHTQSCGNQSPLFACACACKLPLWLQAVTGTLTAGQRYHPPTPMLRKPRRRHMGTHGKAGEETRTTHCQVQPAAAGDVWCWGRVAGRQIPCRATTDAHVKPPVSPRWWE
jgi:hypothetical protein